ncbi:DUF1566 domain-containing protein, partial [Thiohalocapsa marina]|uniref:Lcl domain-containing protein n=1 Tax=Thiohalocapsa marina TaxID=424902 RepID=UPI0036DCB72E
LKPGYAPEEQYRSRGKQGPWTDVYGLAATLYRAVTGTVPPEALDRLDQDDLVAPSRLGIAIPEGQEAVLLKALAVKADARYPSMQGLQEGWREVRSAQAKPPTGASPSSAAPKRPTASATPAPASERSLPESPRRRGIGWLLAVVVIGVLAFVGLGTFFEADDPTSPKPPTTQDVVPTTPPTSPPLLSSRYRPLGADGSIIEDQTTGLQWMRCSQGQHWNGVTCEGVASKLAWEDAMQQPRGFSFAEYTDWRVPTKDELRTLVYCSSGQPETWSDTDAPCEGDFKHPTIDHVAFPDTPDSWFWSSSPNAYVSDLAWYVDFSNGYVNGDGYKHYTGYVRLVRGGPPIRDATPTPQPAPPPQVMSGRYRPLGADGSIIEDRTTGLHWMRCSQGQHWNGVTCDGDASKLTWEEAMRQPRGFSTAGYTDWRVPTKDELRTLIYCSSGQPETWKDTDDPCEGDFEPPTIDQIAFPTTTEPFWFWSSSPHAEYSASAWFVDFGYGDVDGNDNDGTGYGYVRLVRGGPPIRDATPTPQPAPLPQVMSDRYRPLGADGSIIEDRTTGLQWMRCSQGQRWNGLTCDGDAAKLTWEEAMQQPRGFSFAGYTNWRVPTKDDLGTLVYCSSGRPKTWNDTGDLCEGHYVRPTIDQAAFPGTPNSWFWSSSPNAYNSDVAWGVVFDDGYVDNLNKNVTRYVRLVRAGQ